MIRGVLTGLIISMLLLAGPGTLEAGGCKIAVPYHKPAVVHPVVPVVAKFAPIVVPFYGSVHIPPPTVPAPVAAPGAVQGAPPIVNGQPGVAPQLSAGDPMAEVLRQLKVLADRMDRFEGKPVEPLPQQMPPASNGNGNGNGAPPPAPAGNGGNGNGAFLQLVQRHCASCHDGARAKGAGGGFAMTDGGKLSTLTPEQLGDVVARVTSKNMPKNAPASMTDAERLAFVAALASGAGRK